MHETARAVKPLTPDRGDAMQMRLQAAAITAAGIQEPADADPRPLPGLAPRALAIPARPRVVTAQPATPPRLSPGDGLRLIPLAGFLWGGARRGHALPPAPRVRGDHALLLPDENPLKIEFPRRDHILMPRCIAFIPAGTAFALQPDADAKGLALLIAPAHGRDLTVPLPAGFHHGLPASRDRMLLQAAVLALGAASPGDSNAADAIHCNLAQIAAVLSRLDRSGDQGAALPPQLAGARPLTDAFLQLAGRELAQSHTIAEMAGRIGCSQAELDRACLQSRGRRALDLLYDLRLQCAARALRDSARPVAEIALDLGYAGPGHFMRAFAAATGRTPETYRHVMRHS